MLTHDCQVRLQVSKPGQYFAPRVKKLCEGDGEWVSREGDGEWQFLSVRWQFLRLLERFLAYSTKYP